MKSRRPFGGFSADAMSETLLKYGAGEIDWRPQETLPEDFYAA
jgi:hypothetical protein